MDELAGRPRRLDRIEEADELLVPVPGHAVAERRAVADIVIPAAWGGGPCGIGSGALRLMGHGAALERQAQAIGSLKAAAALQADYPPAANDKYGGAPESGWPRAVAQLSSTDSTTACRSGDR